MKVLELRDISFGYPTHGRLTRGGANISWILKHISFSITKGAFTTILGANGSGKTTLLKLILRALIPQRGELYWDHRPYQTLSQRTLSQNIAYVPQTMDPLFSMSVMDFVLLGRAPFLQGLSFESNRDIEIAYESLLDTGSISFKDRDFHTLSGGEKQRVLLAKALTQSPKLLLLDEPTAHLDIKHQWGMLSLLKKLHQKKQLTILMVLHDFQLASEFSDEIIFLKDQTLKAKGAPQTLLTEENIHDTFGIEVGIDQNPYTKNIRMTYKGIYET